MQIIATLKSYGITAKIQTNFPGGLDSDAFFMSLSDNRKSLRLNSKGRAEVVHGDADHRQVILRVTEDARVIQYRPQIYNCQRKDAISSFRRRYNTPDATEFIWSTKSAVLAARAPESTTY